VRRPFMCPPVLVQVPFGRVALSTQVTGEQVDSHVPQHVNRKRRRALALCTATQARQSLLVHVPFGMTSQCHKISWQGLTAELAHSRSVTTGHQSARYSAPNRPQHTITIGLKNGVLGMLGATHANVHGWHAIGEMCVTCTRIFSDHLEDGVRFLTSSLALTHHRGREAIGLVVDLPRCSRRLSPKLATPG